MARRIISFEERAQTPVEEIWVEFPWTDTQYRLRTGIDELTPEEATRLYELFDFLKASVFTAEELGQKIESGEVDATFIRARFETIKELIRLIIHQDLDDAFFQQATPEYCEKVVEHFFDGLLRNTPTREPLRTRETVISV